MVHASKAAVLSYPPHVVCNKEKHQQREQEAMQNVEPDQCALFDCCTAEEYEPRPFARYGGRTRYVRTDREKLASDVRKLRSVITAKHDR